MDVEIFFERVFIDSELADNVCRDLNISRGKYSELVNRLDSERKSEIQQIKRIRSLYHGKKNLPGFKFDSFNSFYKWYVAQYQFQKGKCYYCNTEEMVISALFDKKFVHRKRTNRGKHLEIERRDSQDNSYSPENCVLACYFCNNDKSDLFNEEEYRQYLEDRNGYLLGQYQKLNDTR